MIDGQLIFRAQENDSEAFEQIFIQYSKKVYRVANLILKDSESAEDIVQDTFLQVHRKLYKLKDVKAFECWLYKITVNMCYRMLKSKNKLKTLSMDEKIDLGEYKSDVDFELPDEIVLRKETQEFIIECIESLPVNYRTVVTLFYSIGNYIFKKLWISSINYL